MRVADLGLTGHSTNSSCVSLILSLVSDDEHSFITSDTALAWMINLLVLYGQIISVNAYWFKIMSAYLISNALSNIDTYTLTAKV